MQEPLHIVLILIVQVMGTSDEGTTDLIPCSTQSAKLMQIFVRQCSVEIQTKSAYLAKKYFDEMQVAESP